MKQYAALYICYSVSGFNEYDELKDAISFLEYGSDENLHLPVGVIDTETKEIAWQANYFPNQEKKELDGFIKEHLSK